MTKTAQVEIPQILERYELKYHIPFELVEPISQFVRPYCSLDEYSERESNGFYMINNLYLDSPFYTFLNNRLEGAEKRFNMRIRSYGADPVPPYFFEIKYKTGDIIRKFRVKCQKGDAQEMLNCPDVTEKYRLKGKDAQNMELFQRLAIQYGIEPKVFTQYVRKAWISDIDDYARVTFDIDLKCMEAEGFIFRPDPLKMEPYDNETIFQPGCNTILELKCYTSSVPLWMIDLIKEFDLKRSSFSKYSNGALKVLKWQRSYLKGTDQSDR